jgi:hypothetical protein
MMSVSATSGKPVLSPAMANPAYSRFLRSAPSDFISLHSYPVQLLPTGNFLASFALPAAQLMATPGTGVMRLIATETGYQSGIASGDISNLAASKYIPRTFAEYFRLGVLKTYLFELADVAGGYRYGLLDDTLTPKAAYTTVRNLIGMLGESTWNASTQVMTSPIFDPGVLDYTISGITPSVHHLLLQKSNGAIYLLLWQEVPSYNLTANADIVNPTVPVQLNFNTAISTAIVYALESTTPIATYSNPQSLTINVPDEVVIVQLTPGAEAAPTGTVISMLAKPAGSNVSPFTAGAFVITRTGSTIAPLTVSYSIGGTAINGVDYDSISGSVQIPIGLVAASIPIAPINPLIIGGKEVIAAISPDSSYGLASQMSSKVYVNPSRTVVDDFEAGIQGWKGCTYSNVSFDTANADTGNGDLKWTYTNDGIHRWANTIQLSFSSAQDWSTVSRLELRIKEGASNSTDDIGAPIYFTWDNNGVSVGGGFGATKFPLSGDSTYRSVSLDLGDLPRNQVNSIVFYVDGSTLAAGSYTFYIDNICALTDTNGVLDDIEQYAGSNWSANTCSSTTGDSQNADTGVFGLKWTYNNNGMTRWSNDVGITFDPPRDLTRYSTLSLRFKENASNPGGDIGKAVYLDWHNNGISASGGYGAASFKLTGANGYRTVQLSLGALERDKVDYLCFYVDGSTLGTGKHLWYLDNISFY